MLFKIEITSEHPPYIIELRTDRGYLAKYQASQLFLRKYPNTLKFKLKLEKINEKI